MNSILKNEKMRVENPTKTWVWEDSSFCPENSNKNAVQELHLRVPPTVLITKPKQIYKDLFFVCTF
jgi:hypothetical protein